MKECNVSYGESSLRVSTLSWEDTGLSASITGVRLMNARLQNREENYQLNIWNLVRGQL